MVVLEVEGRKRGLRCGIGRFCSSSSSLVLTKPDCLVETDAEVEEEGSYCMKLVKVSSASLNML